MEAFEQRSDEVTYAFERVLWHCGYIRNKLEGVRVDAERRLTTEVQMRNNGDFCVGISR